MLNRYGLGSPSDRRGWRQYWHVAENDGRRESLSLGEGSRLQYVAPPRSGSGAIIPSENFNAVGLCSMKIMPRSVLRR